MTSFNILRLTGEQIRAARALSRIEQVELARLSGLSTETIKRLERIRGPVEANARTLRAIQDAFETLGVQFSGDLTGRIGVARVLGPRDGRHSDQGGKADSDEQLHRLVYHSKIRSRGHEGLRATLGYINAEAETLHTGLDLTGVLLAREGWLLQGIEGDKDRVHRAYRAISAYPEHECVHLLDDGPAPHRTFSGFTFCCGRFAGDGLLNASADLAAPGMTPDRASMLLSQACLLQRSTPRSGRGAPGACALADTCLDSACSNRDRSIASEITPHATL
jgi:transcriptional regulator with XRE-family HTH domain